MRNSNYRHSFFGAFCGVVALSAALLACQKEDIDELIKQHLEEEKQLRQDDTAANSTGGKRSIKLKGQGADADPDDDEEDDDEEEVAAIVLI